MVDHGLLRVGTMEDEEAVKDDENAVSIKKDEEKFFCDSATSHCHLPSRMYYVITMAGTYKSFVGKTY